MIRLSPEWGMAILGAERNKLNEQKNIMYPSYPNTEEGQARRVLDHPDGEEYPGANDYAREILIKNGDNPRDVYKKYGEPYGFRGMSRQERP